MEKADRLIKNFVLKRGLTRRLLAYLVCKTVDEVSRGEFKAIAFKDGTLFLKAKDHLLAHRLNLRSKELLQVINQKLKYPAVKKIRVTG